MKGSKGFLGLCFVAVLALLPRAAFAEECMSDADCAAGESCQYGFCMPGGGGGGSCMSDADCADGEACYEGWCMAGSAGDDCVSDADCAPGEFCSYGYCLTGGETPRPCESDADCFDDEMCDNGYCAGSTEPMGDCLSDADCGYGEACMEGYCMPAGGEECGADASCPEGEACIDGYCMPGGEIPAECTSDADCGPDARCYEGYCMGGGDYTPCGADAECGAGEMCIWGICVLQTEGYCRADTDCPAGQVCQGCFCEDAGASCASDADCGELERCETIDIGMTYADPTDGGGAPAESEDVCTYSRGYCVIDFESIPEDPRCEAFCSAVMACEGSTEGGGGGEVPPSEGEGSGEGTDGEFDEEQFALEGDDDGCMQYCSWLLADSESAAGMAALVECASANAGDCDAIYEQCADEYEALEPSLSDTTVSVDAGAPQPGSGGTGTVPPDSGAERETAAQSNPFSAIFGGGAGGSGGGGGGGGGAGGSDDGDGTTLGCSAAPVAGALGTGAPWVLVLLGLALGRRSSRRRN